MGIDCFLTYALPTLYYYVWVSTSFWDHDIILEVRSFLFFPPSLTKRLEKAENSCPHQTRADGPQNLGMRDEDDSSPLSASVESHLRRSPRDVYSRAGFGPEQSGDR